MFDQYVQAAQWVLFNILNKLTVFFLEREDDGKISKTDPICSILCIEKISAIYHVLSLECMDRIQHKTCLITAGGTGSASCQWALIYTLQESDITPLRQVFNLNLLSQFITD